MKKEKIIVWCDNIIEFSLCALVFTLPFSKSMVEIFFVLALACWSVKRWIEHGPQTNRFIEKSKKRFLGLIKTFKPVKTELNLPITMFVFFGFLSTITSVSLRLSLEGFFFKLIQWIMIYFIVAETIDSKNKMDKILMIILISMVLIGADGVFQFIRGTDFIRGYSMIGDRMQGPFGNSSSFAGWLVIMIPLVLSLAYFGKDNRLLSILYQHNWLKKVMTSLFWILTGLLIVCLALSYSRGAWIAGLLSLIFLGIFRTKKLLIITIVILLLLSFVAPDSIKERTASIIRISKANTDRFSLWQEALDIIKDFPLLGCGLNTYATVAPHYKITGETGVYPHNSYLHMAAESGLLGLGAFIWIMVTLFKTSLVNLKRIHDKFHSAILIGLLTGLFGFLAHSFVDVNIYTLQLGNLMWFIMGLIVAVQKVSLGGRND